MGQNRNLAFFAILFLLPRVAYAQANPANRPDPLASSVSGAVVNSLTGEPLGYATVNLQEVLANGMRFGAMTTPDGRFSVGRLPAGQYQITSKYRKYSEDPTSSKLIELKQSEEMKDLKLRLIPPASISGEVTDQTGAPTENVSVRAENRASIASTVTDDHGEFRIGGLSPGAYRIVASPGENRMPPEVRTDGSSETNYAPTYYPGVLEKEAASRIELVGGDEVRDIEIRLHSFPVLKVDGWISGVPIDGQCADLMLTRDQTGSGVPFGLDRRFTIWRLAPGKYYVSARCQDAAGRLLRSGNVAFEIRDSNVENIELKVASPFTLAGQVEIDTSSGAAPIAHGTQLTLEGAGVSYQTEVAPDGTFRFADLSLGRYRVKISGPSPTSYVRSVHFGLNDAPDNFIDLQSGPPREPVTVFVAKANGKISGSVRGSSGPVDKAVVFLFSEDSGNQFPKTASVKADGAYLFDGIAPGKYKILAIEDPQYTPWWQTDDLTLYEGAMEPLEVLENDEITKDLNVLSKPGVRRTE